MTVMTHLVLKDHGGTDHTFNPEGLTAGVATYVETSGVPIGDRTISYSVKSTSTGKRKITMKMAIPVVQDSVVNGISKPSVVRTAYVNADITFDSTSNTAERQDVRAFFKNLLADTDIGAAIEDLSPPFAG